MKLSIEGNWNVGGSVWKFTVKERENQPGVVTGVDDFMARIKAQTITNGTLTITDDNGKTATVEYRTEGLFLTIFKANGQVDSMWVQYGSDLVQFDPTAPALKKV